MHGHWKLVHFCSKKIAVCKHERVVRLRVMLHGSKHERVIRLRVVLQGSAAHHHLLEKEVQQLTAALDALPAHELNDKAGWSNLFFFSQILDRALCRAFKVQHEFVSPLQVTHLSH